LNPNCLTENPPRYYTGPEHPDSSDPGDLSWDEGDLPHQQLKVWTFNDFMGQYNQLYAFLNNIQVLFKREIKEKEKETEKVTGEKNAVMQPPAGAVPRREEAL
jgi:hypothetical protein